MSEPKPSLGDVRRYPPPLSISAVPRAGGVEHRLAWFAAVRALIAEDVLYTGDRLIDEGWELKNIGTVLESAENSFMSQLKGTAEMAKDLWIVTRTTATP